MFHLGVTLWREIKNLSGYISNVEVQIGKDKNLDSWMWHGKNSQQFWLFLNISKFLLQY